MRRILKSFLYNRPQRIACLFAGVFIIAGRFSLMAFVVAAGWCLIPAVVNFVEIKK